MCRADEKTKEELDVLIGGGTIEKQIHEDITYAKIYESDDEFVTKYMLICTCNKESQKLIPAKKEENLYNLQTIRRNALWKTAK